MKPSDLNENDKWFLQFCFDNPHFQYDGNDRCIMNTLAAFGLVRYAGNSKFEMSEDGEDILLEINAQETSEEIPLHLQ